MSLKNNILKALSFVLLVSAYSQAIASYDSQIKQVDELIQKNMNAIKSTEKLDIPEYKGDTLTFERLSKIRNVFNEDHFLPFEKRKVREPIAKQQQNTQNTVKLKPIIIPKELQTIMDEKETALQSSPLASFCF